jgi:DNA-binding NtrC family response regulator
MARHTGDKGGTESSPTTITVLSVSPAEGDHSVLRDFLHGKPVIEQPKLTWLVHVAGTLETAVEALQNGSIAIIICESNLSQGTWIDLLEQVHAHPQPPLMIVTSQLADEYLWVEALNRGAYDVLRKPFDPDELTRVVTMASHNWSHRHTRHKRR